MNDNFRTELEQAYKTLNGYMKECAAASKMKYGGDIEAYTSSDGHYYSLWSDDFLFPVLVCPELLDKNTLQRIADFITDSIVDLEYLPDRIEPDGLPIM